MFKKIAIVAALITTALTGNAYAADSLVGHKMAAGPEGHPICTENVDDLREFVMAALLDKEQLDAILKDGKCGMVKKGTPIAVLDDLTTDDDAAFRVLKIRAMARKVQ